MHLYSSQNITNSGHLDHILWAVWVSYHFIQRGLGLMKILPVKSVACFKINSESLEVSWDLGVTWEVWSTPTTPVTHSVGHWNLPTTPSPLHTPHLLAVRSLVTIDLVEKEPDTPPSRNSGSEHNVMPNSPQKNMLIVRTSQLFFQSFVVILKETIHKIFLYVDRLLWRTWTWLLKCRLLSWDQVAFPPCSTLHYT